jgi:hypothetical protein
MATRPCARCGCPRRGDARDTAGPGSRKNALVEVLASGVGAVVATGRGVGAPSPAQKRLWAGLGTVATPVPLAKPAVARR